MSYLDELFDLTGKVVVITGGSRGLGREMAYACAHAGADLVITQADWLTGDRTILTRLKHDSQEHNSKNVSPLVAPREGEVNGCIGRTCSDHHRSRAWSGA